MGSCDAGNYTISQMLQKALIAKQHLSMVVLNRTQIEQELEELPLLQKRTF
jgi:chaperonin cofactor prefoldin